MRLFTIQNKLQPTVTIQIVDDYIEDQYGSYDIVMLEFNTNHGYINKQRISLIAVSLEELIANYNFPVLTDGSYPSFIDRLIVNRKDITSRIDNYTPVAGTALYEYKELF